MSEGEPASLLETENLTARFGSFVAVNGVSLRIEPGARQALIGPNGAGKTTLINLLTGIILPSAGRIVFHGADISRLGADRRARLGIARTFQINTLFPRLTPRQTLVMAVVERDGIGGVWWRRLGRRGVIFDEVLDILQTMRLDDCADVTVSDLPYGKQRLLEIALALASRPNVLLLDEPAAGIPEDESGDVFAVIEALPPEMSVLFIEHDMKLVFRFARRISVLAQGAILAEGTPDEVARDPRVRAVYLGGLHV